MKYERGTAYLLCAFSAIGISGIHRFYLKRRLTGLLWLLTFGLLGIGTIVDLFRLSKMVDDTNAQERKVEHHTRYDVLDPAPPRATQSDDTAKTQPDLS